MFEDSLMESQNRLWSCNRRWTTIVSITLQCAVVAAIVALPLFHPEALPFHVNTPNLIPLRTAPRPVPHVDRADTGSAAASATHAARPSDQPTHFQQLTERPSEAPPAISIAGGGMGDTLEIPSALGNSASSNRPHVSLGAVDPSPKGLAHISTGVSTGMLLAPIVPVYPRIAIATRTEGVVVVEGIISKSGRIETAHVVSGPEMLRQAALDAIRNAHYTPYLLNGSPTEVETSVMVNFRLSQ